MNIIITDYYSPLPQQGSLLGENELENRRPNTSSPPLNNY